MTNKYAKEECIEALKLADEIGVAGAARRLGIKEDTLYGWRGREKKRTTVLKETGEPMVPEELRAENANMRAELCAEAFERACRADGARGMILHSDRGSQFTSSKFRDVLAKRGAVQSMSGVGRCYDNARMESFFATLKKEKLCAGLEISVIEFFNSDIFRNLEQEIK